MHHSNAIAVKAYHVYWPLYALTTYMITLKDKFLEGLTPPLKVGAPSSPSYISALVDVLSHESNWNELPCIMIQYCKFSFC